MVTTIQESLRPLFVTHFILGLGVYPIKQSKPRIQWIIYLSVLYSLTVWFIHSCIYYYYVSFITYKISFLTTIIKVLTGINVFTTIMSAFVGMYQQKRLQICIKMLAAIDDTLEQLGTPKIYRKMHMWSKRVIIGWIVCRVTIDIYDTIWWLRLKQISVWGFFVAFILNHYVHINTFNDIFFIFLMWYIGIRFDKVNEHMEYLIEQQGLWCTARKGRVIGLYQTDNYKHVIWTSMHLHLELCRVARELNLIFGIQMTLKMVSHFAHLTTLSYYLSLALMPAHEKISVFNWIGMSIWIVTMSLRFYCVNYIYESVSIKANKVDQIIHQITNTSRCTDVWKEIYQFTLQAIHHPLKFTGIGFFCFGNELVRKFCMTLVMYLIILVQMKVSILGLN